MVGEYKVELWCVTGYGWIGLYAQSRRRSLLTQFLQIKITKLKMMTSLYCQSDQSLLRANQEYIILVHLKLVFKCNARYIIYISDQNYLRINLAQRYSYADFQECSFQFICDQKAGKQLRKQNCYFDIHASVNVYPLSEN
ncbi:hypothetical protein FGO68_gene3825 [Halteria grandinella]|uniref:Uncharacterized protein n=1 Tax=Halteria grandinella TaxID=5974 RepID=A0A8J8P8G0_HALGN|nr:hypothetical protein FGO68_gene3825 [Halteria grandinella]